MWQPVISVELIYLSMNKAFDMRSKAICLEIRLAKEQPEIKNILWKSSGNLYQFVSDKF